MWLWLAGEAECRVVNTKSTILKCTLPNSMSDFMPMLHGTPALIVPGVVFTAISGTTAILPPMPRGRFGILYVLEMCTPPMPASRMLSGVLFASIYVRCCS